MKMIYSTLVWAILAIAPVACNNVDLNPDASSSRTTLMVSMPENCTKVSMAEKTDGSYPLAWESGDRLLLNYSIVTDALAAEYAGSRTAVFTTTEKIAFPIVMVWPSELETAGDCFIIPAEQTALQGKLSNGYGILAGVASGSKDGATLKHSCGYIRIAMTGSKTLKSVKLSSRGEECLAGRYSVNVHTGEIVAVESPANKIESSTGITLSTDKSLSSEESVFYFAVPAGNYANGFSLTATDTEGKAMTKTMYSATGKTITAGVVTEMPVFEYVPATPENEVFKLSKSEIEFTATGYAEEHFSVKAADEDVRVSVSGLGWMDVEFPTVVPAGRIFSCELRPQTANVSDTRNGSVTFTGTVSGETKTLNISQDNLYVSQNGFPALWEIYGSSTYVTSGVPNEAGRLWLNEGISTAQLGNGAGKAYISAGSATAGKKLVYSLDASTSTKTMCIGNMDAGDYIQFSVPVTDIAANTDFDFMLTLNATTTSAPKYWVFEWWDGDQWKCDQSRLMTAVEDGKTKYSFYIQHFSSSNARTFIQSFTLKNAVHNDFVKMRVRAVGAINGAGKALKATPNAYVFFTSATYQACNIVCYDNATAVKDTHKLMQLGNSFTYYYGSAFKLKEICRREGHQMDVRLNLKGSQEFEHHLDNLVFSQEVVAEGGYDLAIIQDGSYFHAEYGIGTSSALVGVTPKYEPEEILALTQRMSSAIRATSPNAQIVLESVWSYSRKAAGDNYYGFGSHENFDYYQWKGSNEIAAASPEINWLSPIGKAFALARSEYGFNADWNYLNYTDNYHPSREGAYLKACVNYLILFGEPFGEHPADCDIDPTVAATLRQIAETVVLPIRSDCHIR